MTTRASPPSRLAASTAAAKFSPELGPTGKPRAINRRVVASASSSLTSTVTQARQGSLAKQRGDAFHDARHPSAEAATLDVGEGRSGHGPRGERDDGASGVAKGGEQADDCAAGPHAADHAVDHAPRDLREDLLTGERAVRLGIVGVRELPGGERSGLSRISSARAIAPAMPADLGTNMTAPPYARIIQTRSLLTPSGITAVKCRHICASCSASAMLVDPLDASITRPPGPRCPCLHAFSRMCRAMRSLVDPLGLRNSSLHQTEGSPSSRQTGTSGVGPSRGA